MAEVLGTVVSTVMTAASTRQQQQQESGGDFKPEQQQSAIDMEGLRIEAPDVCVLIYNSMYDVYCFLHWSELGHPYRCLMIQCSMSTRA